MNKILLFTTVFSLVHYDVTAQEKIPLEFVSYWAADAEMRAVKELENAYVARGGEWYFRPIDSFDKLRTSVLDRINLRIPPDVSQWYGGSDLHQIAEIGAVYSIKEVLGEEVKVDRIRKELHPDVEYRGELMALPVGIHFQNTAFYSRKIFNELGLSFPTTWDEFIRVAPIIMEAGYIPLGSSTTFPFPRRLFNSILLSNTDGHTFNLLYSPGAEIQELRPAIEESFNTFFALRQYTDKAQNEFLWHEVVRAVGANNTALTLIGDYAQSIFMLDGLNPQDDYYCSIAPGNQLKWSYGIDIFIFPKTNANTPSKGQRIFAQMLLNREVQASYISKKGGISIISDVSASPNACVNTSLWGSSKVELIPDEGSRGNQRITGINHFLTNAWLNENYSAAAATTELLELVENLDRSL